MNNEDFSKCNTIMLECEEDPRLNFTFMKQANIDNFHKDVDNLIWY